LGTGPNIGPVRQAEKALIVGFEFKMLKVAQRI
jgi:hypothetical protein